MAHCCQGQIGQADKSSMWITTLLNILFPSGKRIKIDPDHLPGLRPPRSRPKLPVDAARPDPHPASDIDGIYERFIAGGHQKKHKKNHRGVGF